MNMISYAQNGEDVLLQRCFGGVCDGFYIDVGANDPVDLSVTKHFYDQGWRGINVEPLPAAYERLCRERPRDVNLNLGIADREATLTLYELPGQDVLSTFSADQAAAYRARGLEVVERAVPVQPLARVCAAHVHQPIDFLSIDVEDFERPVLAGADWALWRPRVVLVEATLPNTAIPSHAGWEPLILGAGYLFAYFDGLNRFYVRAEDRHLLECFRVPVNVGDRYVPHGHVQRLQQLQGLQRVVDELHGRLEKALTDVGHAHTSWAQTGAVLRETEAALGRTEGRLRASEDRLSATRTRLGETEARLDATQSRLTLTEGRLAEERSQLEQARAQLTRLQTELSRTQEALSAERALMDPFRDLGPVTVRISRLLRDTAVRHPRLAAALKGVLRGARYVQRGLAAPWRKRAS
jgi:FkbM family methyltransferase